MKLYSYDEYQAKAWRYAIASVACTALTWCACAAYDKSVHRVPSDQELRCKRLKSRP